MNWLIGLREFNIFPCNKYLFMSWYFSIYICLLLLEKTEAWRRKGAITDIRFIRSSTRNQLEYANPSEAFTNVNNCQTPIITSQLSSWAYCFLNNFNKLLSYYLRILLFHVVNFKVQYSVWRQASGPYTKQSIYN